MARILGTLAVAGGNAVEVIGRDPAKAADLADAQVPWGADAPGGQVTDAAWRTKPSWYLVTTEDRMIPPAAQHAMAQRAGSDVAEVAGSHSSYISHPAAVADLIKRAATAVTARQ